MYLWKIFYFKLFFLFFRLNEVGDNDKSMMVLFDEEDRFHQIPKERTMKF
jgi:hypothetical protein